MALNENEFDSGLIQVSSCIPTKELQVTPMDSWIQNLTLATNFYIDPVFMDSIQKQEVPNNLGLAGHLDLSQSKVNKTMFCKIIIFTISTSLLKVLSSPILERQI